MGFFASISDSIQLCVFSIPVLIFWFVLWDSLRL
jgi:hypothetical protein